MNQPSKSFCVIFLALVSASACGGTDSGTTGGSGGETSSTGGSTASTGGSAGSGAGTCSGSTPVALTVKNYLGWCTVSAAQGAASPATAQTVCVAAGDVTLSATANTGFKLGDAPWHGTKGDTGSGDPGTVASGKSSATITASGSSACAWVCCEFTSGTGCPTQDQCP